MFYLLIYTFFWYIMTIYSLRWKIIIYLFTKTLIFRIYVGKIHNIFVSRKIKFTLWHMKLILVNTIKHSKLDIWLSNKEGNWSAQELRIIYWWVIHMSFLSGILKDLFAFVLISSFQRVFECFSFLNLFVLSCNFFICLSSLISHPGFEFQFRARKGITILSLTSFAPA